MCGIAGIVDSTDSGRSTEEIAARMRDRLLHRGPDDNGLALPASRQAALAHTRLSIIDLSEAGHQPMTSACGRYTLVFNGEIYNYQALKDDLLAQNVAFRTATDTEVVLELFIREGSRCLSKLRGMFAFAVWDDETKECFLTRDPLGIKPLYYCQKNGSLAFASEIRALLKADLVPPRIDSASLYVYLRTGSVPEPLSLLEDVYQLPAGCSALWKNGRMEISRHWSLEKHFQSKPVTGPEEAAQRARAALADSIQQHFVADVPVGIFLSGGIDSTAVLALARAHTDNAVSTFSISVDDSALNEGDVAKQISTHFNSDHHELHLDENLAGEWIGDFLTCMDSPSIDGFNTYSVSRFASENGAKVVLSGLGGDELFGGYGSFRTIPKMTAAGRALGPLRKPAGLAAGAAAGLLRDNRLQRFAEFLGGPPSVDRAFIAMRGIFTHTEALRILDSMGRKIDAAKAVDTLTNPLRDVTTPDLEPDAISALESTRYMRNQLLRDSDVMSMAHGLELRVPLVDRILFENVASIPAAHRIQPGKKLLTNAVPEIPRWIIDQPKRGFTLPFGSWLDGNWSYLAENLPTVSGLDLSQWYRRWALVALHQWQVNLGLADAS